MAGSPKRERRRTPLRCNECGTRLEQLIGITYGAARCPRDDLGGVGRGRGRARAGEASLVVEDAWRLKA